LPVFSFFRKNIAVLAYERKNIAGTRFSESAMGILVLSGSRHYKERKKKERVHRTSFELAGERVTY